MTLVSTAIGLLSAAVILFVSLSFAEWVDKHSDSFALEIFAKFGMPVVLWAILLLVCNVLEKNGIIT